MDGINSSDIIIACPETSDGVNIAIGWASLLKKKIIILLSNGERVSCISAGLSGITETRVLMFKDISDLRIKLKNCLNEFVGQK